MVFIILSKNQHKFQRCRQHSRKKLQMQNEKKRSLFRWNMKQAQMHGFLASRKTPPTLTRIVGIVTKLKMKSTWHQVKQVVILLSLLFSHPQVKK